MVLIGMVSLFSPSALYDEKNELVQGEEHMLICSLVSENLPRKKERSTLRFIGQILAFAIIVSGFIISGSIKHMKVVNNR